MTEREIYVYYLYIKNISGQCLENSIFFIHKIFIDDLLMNFFIFMLMTFLKVIFRFE